MLCTSWTHGTLTIYQIIRIGFWKTIAFVASKLKSDYPYTFFWFFLIGMGSSRPVQGKGFPLQAVPSALSQSKTFVLNLMATPEISLSTFLWS